MGNISRRGTHFSSSSSQSLAISFTVIPDSCNLLTQVICSSAKSMEDTIINTDIIAAESDQLTIYILSHNLA